MLSIEGLGIRGTLGASEIANAHTPASDSDQWRSYLMAVPIWQAKVKVHTLKVVSLY